MTDQFKDHGGPIYGGLNRVINNTGRPEFMHLTSKPECALCGRYFDTHAQFNEHCCQVRLRDIQDDQEEQP